MRRARVDGAWDSATGQSESTDAAPYYTDAADAGWEDKIEKKEKMAVYPVDRVDTDHCDGCRVSGIRYVSKKLRR